MKSKLVMFVALMLSTSTTWAVSPENGWWWNPAKSGTGYNIEAQNGVLFVSTFVYDEAGNPIWYSGSGQLNGDEAVIIDLLRFSGGQCLGCTYTVPQTNNSGFQITLDFSDPRHGTIRLNGDETPIIRFNFNLGAGVEKLLGKWIMAIMVPGTNSFGLSDIITYTHIKGGTAFGARAFDSAHVSAVAKAENTKNLYASVMPISDTEKMVALFTLSGLNTLLGLAAIMDISADPQEAVQKIQDSSKLFVGFRSKFIADAQTTPVIKLQAAASYESSAFPSMDAAKAKYEANQIAARVDEEMAAKIMHLIAKR